MSPEFRRPVSEAPLTEEDWNTEVTLMYMGKSWTYPLRDWLGFCPKPEEDIDPIKKDEAARALLRGEIPSFMNTAKDS